MKDKPYTGFDPPSGLQTLANMLSQAAEVDWPQGEGTEQPGLYQLEPRIFRMRSPAAHDGVHPLENRTDLLLSAEGQSTQSIPVGCELHVHAAISLAYRCLFVNEKTANCPQTLSLCSALPYATKATVVEVQN